MAKAHVKGRKRVSAGASALLSIILLGACANSGAYGPGWSAAHGDARNSDYANVKGSRNLTLAWSREFGGMINLGATRDPMGRVYVTSSGAGCHLHVLDPQSGRTIWCSAALDQYAVSSSAIIDRQGRAFVADSRAMHAFAPDGRILWRTPIGGIPLSAQFTPKGAVIFITHIGRIYVLRRETGEPLVPVMELIPGATFDPTNGARACMRGTIDCPSANTLAIDLRNGRFYFTFWTPGAPNSGLRAMQIIEGRRPEIRQLWINDALPGGSASSPDLTLDGRRLYVTANDGGLHALDAATGRVIWSHHLGYESGGSVASAPDGIILPAGGGQAALLGVRDLGDRAEEIWRRPNLINRGIPTQVAGGLAYATVSAGAGENDLIVVDTRTGEQLDRERIPGRTLFTVGTTIGEHGAVYVPTINGKLFAFEPAEDAVGKAGESSPR